MTAEILSGKSITVGRLIQNLLPLSLVPWLGGCGLYGPCYSQRGIVLYAPTTSTDIRTVDQIELLSSVAFWEKKGTTPRWDVHWTIWTLRLRGSVTAVHMHAGTSGGPGSSILYAFPLENARRDATQTLEVVTAGSVQSDDQQPGTWYHGTAAIADLLQRMYAAPTYLEVHTDSAPAGEFRAPFGTPAFYLPPADPGVWQSVYCS